MRNKLMIIAGLILVAATGYSALLNVDFESDTVGNAPGNTVVLMGGATMTVIDSAANKAGTGNGLQLADNNSSDYVRIGYNFTEGTGETAVKISMDIARLTAGTSGSAFLIGVIQKDLSSGSYHDRYAFFSAYDDGRLRYVAGTSGFDADTDFFTLNESHNLTMYLNDGDTEITDYSGTFDLAADSVAFWVDGSLWATTTLRTDASYGVDPANTTSALGQIGIISSSTNTGLDYAIDNLSVTVIPEPATVGLFGLTGLACLFVRRRFAR